MSTTRRTCLQRLAGGLLALSTLAAPALATAQSFPDKPVRMIVAFPPGGGTDIVARLIAEQLSSLWKQQVVVDNRAGAGGVIGTAAAARAAPDGYTIFMATLGNLAINPYLYNMPVNTATELMPITNVVNVSFVLVANPNFPAQDVQSLIRQAKAQPGQINYSSSGVGGAPHLAGELFSDMAGVQLTHIPYKGSGPSFTDLIGGQVSLTFDSLVQSLPHIQAGKLRPLGVLAAQRSALLPDVPTLAEAGVPGYDFSNWFGLVAPAGVPDEVILKINEGVRTVLARADVRDKLAQMGAVPADDTPAAFGAQLQAEHAKWKKIIEDKQIKAP